jgi:GrpB-like predicted nucleotidyltransferase (UPF0157 family)
MKKREAKRAFESKAEMDDVVIVDYNSRWPSYFAEEAERIRQVFGTSLVALEHIGSTSVPGLAAKPIVDIQVIVQSVADAQSAAPALSALGWEQGTFALDPETRLYFKKRSAAGVRTHQLHVYAPDHPAASAHLLFRDYLRAHPEEAALYAALKRELAQQFPTDRLAYNDAKTAYVEAVVAKARG